MLIFHNLSVKNHFLVDHSNLFVIALIFKEMVFMDGKGMKNVA